MDELSQIRESTTKSYNLVAARYHELFKDEMKRKEFDRLILDKFADYFDSKSIICDMGCGPSGHIGKYLLEKGLNIFGIDISGRCVEIARRENPEMSFLVTDMARLNIADESIDGIISFYSIIHTPKRLMNVLFGEFNRVLKNCGKILLAVKEGDTEGYVDELLGYRTRIYSTYFRKKEIQNYLDTNGFKPILLEVRRPYDFEIPNRRIYAIGEKL